MVSLTLRTRLDRPLEVEGLTGDRLAGMSEREIAQLPAWSGREPRRLGDCFDVRGERSPRVEISGDLTLIHGIGAGMTAGDLRVVGDAGDRVGAGMTGGAITVTGRVGADAGMAMSGGALHVHGDAGDRAGGVAPGAARGMSGGEIVIAGSAGADVGARSRRGLIAVGRDVGPSAARAVIAGTLVVLGRVADEPGRGSRRGTVIAVGGASIPATYAYACTYEPPYVRLLLTYLSRHTMLRIDPQLRDGRYRRYCGDLGEPGKGEILLYTGT